MYQLLVHYPDEVGVRGTVTAGHGAGIDALVRDALDRHPGCAWIDVRFAQKSLYRVDRTGRRLEQP